MAPSTPHSRLTPEGGKLHLGDEGGGRCDAAAATARTVLSEAVMGSSLLFYVVLGWVAALCGDGFVKYCVVLLQFDFRASLL